MSLDVNPAVRRSPVTAPLQRPTGTQAPTAPLDPLGMAGDWVSMSGAGTAAATGPSTSDLVARVQAAQATTAPAAASSGPIDASKQDALNTFNTMLGGIRKQRQSLKKLLKDANPGERAQIQAQLGQLQQLSSGIAHMRRRLYHYQPPANLTQNEQQTVARSIDQLGNLAKGVAGGTPIHQARVQAAQLLQQMATPGLDLSRDPVAQKHQDAMINLTNVQGRIMDRLDSMTRQMQSADPATAAQIQAQKSQLMRVHGQLEGMQRDLERYTRPGNLNPQEQQRAEAALRNVDNLIKQLAGASGAELQQIRANFTQEMNQVRNPGLDVRQEPLFVNHHHSMSNLANVQGRFMDRRDSLTRQLAGAGAAESMQIHAQLAQLGRVQDDFDRVSRQMAAYRPNPNLTAEQRQEKAALIDQIDQKVKQMAGSTAEDASARLAEINSLFRELRS